MELEHFLNMGVCLLSPRHNFLHIFMTPGRTDGRTDGRIFLLLAYSLLMISGGIQYCRNGTGPIPPFHLLRPTRSLSASASTKLHNTGVLSLLFQHGVLNNHGGGLRVFCLLSLRFSVFLQQLIESAFLSLGLSRQVSLCGVDKDVTVFYGRRRYPE